MTVCADGTVVALGDDTSSEATARRLPHARIVKGFNTIWFKHLDRAAEGSPLEQRHAIFIAGDDEAAKAIVARLIEDIGSRRRHRPPPEGGRRQQPETALYNKVMTVDEGRRAVASDEAAR